MVKVKKSKSVSKVKRKKWNLFSKENLKWGLGSVIIFSLVSVVLLDIPCESYSPFILSICLSQAIFILINFIGAMTIGLIFLNKSTLSTNTYLILSIILNTPIYFLIGIAFKKIFYKIKK